MPPHRTALPDDVQVRFVEAYSDFIAGRAIAARAGRRGDADAAGWRTAFSRGLGRQFRAAEAGAVQR
jgi:hypothetical protein